MKYFCHKKLFKCNTTATWYNKYNSTTNTNQTENGKFKEWTKLSRLRYLWNIYANKRWDTICNLLYKIQGKKSLKVKIIRTGSENGAASVTCSVIH